MSVLPQPPSMALTMGDRTSNPLTFFAVPQPDVSSSVTERPSAQHVDEQGCIAAFKRLDEYVDQHSDRPILKEATASRTESDLRRDKRTFAEYCFNVVCSIHKSPLGTTDRITTLDIQSQSLRTICRRTISDNEPISWSSKRLRIDPLVIFRFYRTLYEHLQTMKSESPAPVGAAHLELLLDFIRDEFAGKFNELEELTSRGEITYELLGSLFLPGAILYATCPTTNELRACRLVRARLEEGYLEPGHWELKVAYVEARGKRTHSQPQFGHAAWTQRINQFGDAVQIVKLTAYPTEWHPCDDEVRKHLIARGRAWQALDGVLHKRYDGVAYEERPYKGDRRVMVNSRIMVDRVLYDTMSQYSAPNITQPDTTRRREKDGYIRPDQYPLLSDLSDNDLLLTPALVYGFSLEHKRWLKFNVRYIADIVWNEQAFSQLVLPEAQKDLIKGLVEAQVANIVKFDDFIEGKGRGLVMNLFGPPGVGKTMSAEATSEHLRRPLYIVGADDLGTSPAQLSGALTSTFKISAAWGAVVLIDEADVYMQQRSLHDLERNALVSVFLRQLEYFAGLLFLTTNRVQTFDEAFQSRIHVSLRYGELDEEARRKLWHGFLDKLGMRRGHLSPDEETSLIAIPMNGRQIKNAVRTAAAVASSRKEPIGFKHIKGVVGIVQQFEKDFATMKATVKNTDH